MAEGNGIAEIFDTREDGLKCVRFESGNVGVVDKHGKVILQYDKSGTQSLQTMTL